MGRLDFASLKEWKDMGNESNKGLNTDRRKNSALLEYIPKRQAEQASMDAKSSKAEAFPAIWYQALSSRLCDLKKVVRNTMTRSKALTQQIDSTLPSKFAEPH